MSTTNDQLVLQLLQKVKSKQAEIKASEKPQWLTSCSLGFTDNLHDKVNIQTLSDISKLIDLYATLSYKHENWVAAAKELGLKPSHRICSYPVEDWKDDIRTRINQILITEKRKELKTLEDRIEKLVTPEQRRDLELAAIQKELEN